ncbi:MAG TPA: DUF6160 family protein [Pseudomonas sp.]|jgi:hypothetical protein|nr:DUF6160 family protein [Pseudomonas sp.]
MLRLFAGLFCLAAPLAMADLRPLEETELAAVNGQDGLTISASIRFNPNVSQTRCAGGCGARVTIRPGQSAGVIAIDNIKGGFSFDGVTLDIVTINSGFNGEGAQFNRDALKLSLREAYFDNAQYTLSGANQVSATQPGFQQTDLLTYHTNGRVDLRGDLYIFPSN